MTTSIERVSPQEVARRLRPKLFGQDIGVVMATTAHHLLGDISSEKPAPASFHAEEGDAYIGSFLEGGGFRDVRFPKIGCRFLVEHEVVRLERSTREVVSPLKAMSEG